MTFASSWPWLDHSASGLPPATKRPYQTRFRSGSGSETLNLATDEQLAGSLCKRHAVSRLQNRSSALSLRPLVGNWFQVLFHSPSGVLFTFPSRYWFTIGHERVFSLGRWSSQIPTGLHVSRGTWDLRSKPIVFRLQGFHLLRRHFPEPSTKRLVFDLPVSYAQRPTGSRNPDGTTRARCYVPTSLG